MADELNIPFNIPGNAEKQLLAVKAAVDQVRQSIKALNEQLTTGPDKAMADQAKRTSETIRKQTRAINQHAKATRDSVQSSNALGEAQVQLSQAAGRVTPLYRQQVAGVKAATRAINSQVVKQEKLIALQKQGFTSTGQNINQLKTEAIAHDNVRKRLIKRTIALKEAAAAQKAGIATQKEQDLLDRAAGRPTAAERRKTELEAAKRQQQALKDLVDDQNRREKEEAQLNQARLKDEQKLKRQQEQFNKRIAAAQLRRGRRQRAREARWAREAEAERKRAARLIDQQRRAQERLNKSGNRAAFIFRRLFGILAAFTAARLALRGFFGGIQASVEFNAKIEQAQLGIASLFLAVGTVRDAMGQTVEATEGLSLAQKEAQRQTKLLRKDALLTAATFDQLLETFQIGLAPGIAAGLNIDEVRKFTLRISQAATAIGLAQNQLAEEIRSILAGTIQARTTRIAVALGITNEDIRRAKEYGRLFEFLENRFGAFEEAGKKAMSTVAGLAGRVKDAFLQLLGAAGEELFDRVKSGLQAIFDTLTIQTPEGFIEPSPEALQAFKAIFDGLEKAADHARETAEALGSPDIGSVSELIGTVISRGAEILLGIFEGIVRAVRVIRDFLRTLGVELPSGEFKELVATITKFVAILFVARSAFGFIAGSSKKLFFVLEKGVKAYQVVAFQLGRIIRLTLAWGAANAKVVAFLKAAATRLLVFGGILAGILIGARALLAKMLDIENLGIMDAVELLVKSFIFGFQEIIADAKTQWIRFKDWLSNSFAPEAVGTFKKIALGVTSVIPGLKDDSIKALEEIYREEDRRKEIRQFGGESPAVRQARLEAEELKKANDEILGNLINKKREAGNVDEVEFQKRMARIQEEKVATESFVEFLERLPLTYGQATDALTVQADVVQKIKEDIEGLSFEAAGGLVGLTGSAVQQARLRVEANKRINDSLKEIDATIDQQEKRLEGIKEQKRDLINQTARLKDAEQDQVSRLAESSAEVFRIDKDIRDLDKEAALLKEGIAAAAEKANFAEKDALVAKREAVLKDKERLELSRKEAIARGEAARAAASPEAARIAAQLVALTGQQESLEKDLEAAATSRATVERDINFLYAERIRLIQEVANAEQIYNIQQKQIEIEALRKINELRSKSFIDVRAIETVAAQARLDSLRKESDLIKAQQDARVDAARKRLEEAVTVEQVRRAQQNLLIAEVQRTQAIEDQNEKIREQEIILERMRKIEEGSITEGLEAGLDEFADQFSSRFEVGMRIARAGIEGLAQLTTDLIQDALDPNSDKTWKQRLGAFLQEFSRMIMNELTKLAIAKALLGLGFGAATGGPIPAPTAVGGFHGGKTRRKALLMSHYAPDVQGLVRGGAPRKMRRPRGLHPKDRIPIWAAEGEFMQPVKAVQAYGADVMEKLRRVAINPFELRALASDTKTHSVRAPATPGFQQGGVVSEVLQPERADQVDQQKEEPVEQEPLVGVVVATEENMDKLLGGGKQAMLNFLHENGFTNT